MKRSSILFWGLLAGMAAIPLPVMAKNKSAASQPATQTAEDAQQFETSASNRADSVVKSLKIDDADKATRVHTIIAREQIAIHQWHLDNDDRIKELGKNGGDELSAIQGKRHALHDGFIAKLSAELTPEQMEIAREKLTGGQMTATYHNYPEIIPNLTDAEKTKILEVLKVGREEAMDANNRTDRIAIFKKYKGQINNYLNSNGHNVAQAYKDWGAAQKLKQSGAATEPAENAAQ